MDFLMEIIFEQHLWCIASIESAFCELRLRASYNRDSSVERHTYVIVHVIISN